MAHGAITECGTHDTVTECGCAAVHACVRLACLRAGVGGGWGLTVYCMLVPSLVT
jgi:hypothetical protein